MYGLLGASYFTYKCTFHVNILAYLPHQLTLFFSTRIERLAAQYKAEMFLFDLIISFSNMRGEMSSLHFVRTLMEKAWKMDLNGVWGGPLRGNSDGT